MKKRLFILMTMATIGAMSISASKIHLPKNGNKEVTRAPAWPTDQVGLIYPEGYPAWPDSKS